MCIPCRRTPSVKLLREHFPHTGVPVVHVSPCETERYDVPSVVAHQVELEAVAPSHRALPVLGQAGEHLVEIPPHVVADGYHRAAHEGYPRALPEGVRPHEQQHVDEHPRHELHETVVGDGVGKTATHPSKHAVRVVLLEVAVSAEMVADENVHHLAPGLPSFPVPVSFVVTHFTR